MQHCAGTADASKNIALMMVASETRSRPGPSAVDEAHDAPVLRELLSVLLEVHADVAVHGAQLERMCAQLERLDVRVAMLEQLAATTPGSAASSKTSSVARFQTAAAARTRSLTLTDLLSDVLDKMVTALDPDNELAASLACRKLRDAIRRHPDPLPNAQEPRRPLQTRVRSLLGSLAKLQWGVASAGAPLNKAQRRLRAGSCGRSPVCAAMGVRQRLPLGRVHVLRSSSRRSAVCVAMAACQRLPVERDHARRGSAWRSLAYAAVGAHQRLPVGRADVHRCSCERSPACAAVGTREGLPFERVHVRRCCCGRAPIGAAVGARQRLPVERGLVRVRGARRPPGRAALGACQWLPVGRSYVRRCSLGRAPGYATVGARPRLPLGRGNVRVGGSWRSPVFAAVGARQRLPLERIHMPLRNSGQPPGCAAACSGRVRMAAASLFDCQPDCSTRLVARARCGQNLTGKEGAGIRTKSASS
jgi:hypothetical protein